MNKKLYTLCAIAAAFVLAGCQKETNNEPAYVGPTHTLTFTAEKMLDSKTAIASEENGLVSYKWNEGDEERMHITESYFVDEVEQKNIGTITSMVLSNGDKSARFEVTFAGEAPNGEVTYSAVYAGHVSGAGNPSIPTAQSPLADSFDPAADVLVSNPIVKDARSTSSTFTFEMNRKVSVNKMTLKGLNPGETIQSVTFQSDQNHGGSYTISSNSYSHQSGDKILTLTYTENNVIPQSGEFPVYFTTVPVTDATFTVGVVTNETRYLKTSTKTISFAVGTVRRFGVDLEGCEDNAGEVFTLVTDASTLQPGMEIVIAANGSDHIAMSTTQNNNNRGSTEAVKNDDWTEITTTGQVQIFTLVAGASEGTFAFSFDDNGTTKYLSAASSSSNNLHSVETLDGNSSWIIGISDKAAIVTAQGTYTHNILRYNSSSKIFSCYASGQQAVWLYAAGGKQSSGLAFAEPAFTFTLGDSDYNDFSGQSLTNPNGLSVIWSSSNENIATVNNSGLISFVSGATGSTTITASFGGNDTYSAGSASYTITVNPASSGSGLPFLETFANCTGTMGWSGSVADGDFIPDHSGWFYSNAYGAEGAARFGKSSGLGSAETPEIEYSGNATLTFKAGAWNGNSESTNLKLSVSSGSLYGDASLTIPISSVTLVKGDWTTYTVYLKNLESPFTVTFAGNVASNSRFFLDDVSIVAGIVQPAASFGASISNTDNVLAAGGTKTINVTGNVSWTASATNGASVSPSSGAGIGSVTVTIPENETSSEKTYSVTISTSADVDTDSYSFTITQDAAPSVVNESTETDPYTPAEAAELADELSGGTMDDVYVYGIISKITTAYNSQYSDVSFDISIDGKDTGSQQFRIFRATASSAEDFVVGDAVEFKGFLKKFNSIYELDGSAATLTLISHLHKPTISPDGGSFTTSQSVTITADSGSTIRYTTNGSDPTATSSVYSSALNFTTTTTVKAIAIKGILTTGVASATFTKDSGGGSAKRYTYTITASDFNTTSYAANNNEKTSTATATDGSTMAVKWTSNQVMRSSDNMQWQKNKGYIYNSTDLGTIISVTVTSSAGTFTTYYGTSAQPSSGSASSGKGYFKTSVGGATGTSSKITVVFEK